MVEIIDLAFSCADDLWLEDFEDLRFFEEALELFCDFVVDGTSDFELVVGWVSAAGAVILVELVCLNVVGSDEWEDEGDDGEQ